MATVRKEYALPAPRPRDGRRTLHVVLLSAMWMLAIAILAVWRGPRILRDAAQGSRAAGQWVASSGQALRHAAACLEKVHRSVAFVGRDLGAALSAPRHAITG